MYKACIKYGSYKLLNIHEMMERFCLFIVIMFSFDFFNTEDMFDPVIVYDGLEAKEHRILRTIR